MDIHRQELPEIDRYLQQEERSGGRCLDSHKEMFRRYFRILGLDPDRTDESTRILEVGFGTGWFPIMCALRGVRCRGIDISPQLVDYARKWGQSLGMEPDLDVANIEVVDLGEDAYDAVIASSIFEHVERWEVGLRRVYRALKPGGVMFFESTNKFAFVGSEYKFPLYGWLPDKMRYKLRMAFDDPDIMKLGIDFNQFRYGQLRRAFRRIGFSRVLDRIDMSQNDLVSSGFRRHVVRIAKGSSLFKLAVLTFCDVTRFVCFK